ncbi:hypothetical protein NEOLI_002309 [Neolecta irregularis DAH-3]|uniref:Uncharacterized protein n=1 Tax=Neolecta irregularis (strain DAH-3) TaxID=1198029 RepID=A0A1U7LQ33_NEOID|nr:hypothetical protein NEOLI_002309 [Neolecta irregularis DAH-3]|eukprot:OLL24754.1 hypothetical protein NEOLI_002309 [Neolecta irregularis DAH-3]
MVYLDIILLSVGVALATPMHPAAHFDSADSVARVGKFPFIKRYNPEYDSDDDRWDRLGLARSNGKAVDNGAGVGHFHYPILYRSYDSDNRDDDSDEKLRARLGLADSYNHGNGNGSAGKAVDNGAEMGNFHYPILHRSYDSDDSDDDSDNSDDSDNDNSDQKLRARLGSDQKAADSVAGDAKGNSQPDCSNDSTKMPAPNAIRGDLLEQIRNLKKLDAKPNSQLDSSSDSLQIPVPDAMRGDLLEQIRNFKPKKPNSEPNSQSDSSSGSAKIQVPGAMRGDLLEQIRNFKTSESRPVVQRPVTNTPSNTLKAHKLLDSTDDEESDDHSWDDVIPQEPGSSTEHSKSKKSPDQKDKFVIPTVKESGSSSVPMRPALVPGLTPNLAIALAEGLASRRGSVSGDESDDDDSDDEYID